MADLGYNFDPEAVPPSDSDFDVIPAGQYDAQITESDVVSTKSGSGRMLKLTWEILSGPFANRKVWQNVNIENQSEKAQEIGQRELARICEATGAGAIRDSQDLHFKPCTILVRVESQPNYGDTNVVKKVRPYQGAGSAPQQAARPPATQPQRGQPGRAQPANAGRQQPAARGPGARPWGNRQPSQRAVEEAEEAF